MAGVRINAELGAVFLEGFRDRAGRCDGVPGRHRGAAVNTTQSGGGVAFGKDQVAHLVAAFDLDAYRAGQMLGSEIPPQAKGAQIGIQQLLFAFVLLSEQLFEHTFFNTQKAAQGPHINDVLEELALAWVGVNSVRNFRQRHANDVNVVTEFGLRQGFGAVIKQVATSVNLGNVGIPGLRVHCHHHVDAATAAEVAFFTHARFVPSGQALDVAGEDVARTHRHAHAQNRLCEEFVGRGRTRAVHVGELDDEVVGGFNSFHAGIPSAFFAADFG